MSRIRFLATNQWSNAPTITGSSEASALPAAAAQNPDRTYVWRSLTQTGVQTLDVTLADVFACTCVAVANVRLLPGGVIQLYQRGSGGSPGAPTLVGTLPTQDAKSRVAFLFFNSTIAKHWQLKWTNPGAVADYAELGFAFLGAYVEPSVNVRLPIDTGRTDPSGIERAVDGQRVATRRSKFFSAGFSMVDVSVSDRQLLDDVYDSLGIASPFFLVLDDTTSWMAWFGSFSSELKQTFSLSINRFTVTFSFEEAR
jgi:hypothetical protein